MKLSKLETNHGTLTLPAFFPDATFGFVRGVDGIDLQNSSTAGIVVNTYHLMQRELLKIISKSGGIHKYMNWAKPIISDSGGFQVMSLIRKNSKLGKIFDDKIIFHMDYNKKIIFTPENCIQTQIKLKSDIIMCLDDCTKPEYTLDEQRKSVERTINWARRCKKEFNKLTKNKNNKPLIFAIIQGGNSKELRTYCAQELIKIGFDGYAFGGWPIDENKTLLRDILQHTANLMPDNLPKYAMGVGKPKDIVECIKMSYNLFDCVIPTREARHAKIYLCQEQLTNRLPVLEHAQEFTNRGKEFPTFKTNLQKINTKKDFYETINIKSKKYLNDNKPLSKFCDCYCCKNYSRSYLCNLFKSGDSLAIRLATIHNLRVYSMLLECLQS